MKNRVYLIILTLLVLIISGCNSKNNSEEYVSPYEKAYVEQFDQLISQLDHLPDYCDTLYTEMYIALKTIKEDETCGDIVLDRVNKLLLIDNDPENQRQYLDAASIVYSIRKDYDKFWDTSKKIWDTYPFDSFERLSSYAEYYSTIQQNADSAYMYIESAKIAAQKLKYSKNQEDRIGYCIGMVTLYVLEGEDEVAKLFIQEYIASEQNIENLDVAKELLKDYEQFKEEILRPINTQ